MTYFDWFNQFVERIKESPYVGDIDKEACKEYYESDMTVEQAAKDFLEDMLY